jgi:formylglycine-generating enzyme
VVRRYILSYRLIPGTTENCNHTGHGSDQSKLFHDGKRGVRGEEPEHKVCLNSFYLGVYEVTQKQFKKVMGCNPSHFKGPNLPVENVSWPEADAYCRTFGGPLPTEAEWKYVARAGSSTAYSWGWDMDDTFAWHRGNSKNMTHPVGQKKRTLQAFTI